MNASPLTPGAQRPFFDSAPVGPVPRVWEQGDSAGNSGVGYDILQGDCLETLRRMPDGIAQTCVTSPPYFGLRDYGHAGQIGLEETPEAFIAKLVEVFREVRRVLRDDGTAWVNMGDSYAANRGSGARSIGAKQATNAGANLGKLRVPSGYKEKDLIGVPWMLAFALRADGWYLRQDIIWNKPNPMPESVTDRCTKAHEYVFLLAKSEQYFMDSAGLKEPAVGGAPGNKRPLKGVGDGGADDKHRTHGGLHANAARVRDAVANGEQLTRNKRSVWTVTTKPYRGAHFATFPPDLIEPCILAGSRPGDLVLDPFGGSGTTAAVALNHGRRAVLCELNPEYIQLAHERVGGVLVGDLV